MYDNQTNLKTLKNKTKNKSFHRIPKFNFSNLIFNIILKKSKKKRGKPQTLYVCMCVYNNKEEGAKLVYVM